MYDLSKLYLNFTECPEGVSLIEHFPELGAFGEFSECSDEMIKIIILLSDIDSPFVRIKEREVMLTAIFEYLKIDKRTHLDMFDKILKYRHPKIISGWLRYLQILHETDFTDWNLARKDYDFFILQSNEPKMDKESDLNYYKRRNEIRDRVRELGQEVRRIEAKLFPDSKAAREAALAESRMKVKLYAESYAEPYNFI